MEWKTLLMALAMASMVVAIPRPQDDEDEEDAGGRPNGGVLPGGNGASLQKSEEFLNNFQANLVPKSYLDKKFYTPVKAQGQCANSVAFATVAAMEVCLRRYATKNVATILSEQYLMDCSYGFQGANGCEGSPIYSHMEWTATVGKQRLCTAKDCPYKEVSDKEYCPQKPVPTPGSYIKDYKTSNTTTEKKMQELVYTYSQVLVALKFSPSAWDQFQDYTRGVFKGCIQSGLADEDKAEAENNEPSNNNNEGEVRTQAAVILGYGKEGADDYWLLKNSWGPEWGEQGYFKLQRGVGMCGVDKTIGFFICAKSSGGNSFAANCEGEEGECDEGEGGEEGGDEGAEGDEEEEK